MTRWAVIALFGLLGCEDEASGLPPSDTPPLIRAEDPADPDGDFRGCHFPMTPFLHITQGMTTLDGMPVSDSELQLRLAAKQDLNRQLGGTTLFEVVVQVAPGVPERRVVRLLNRARDAGFFSATRMNPE